MAVRPGDKSIPFQNQTIGSDASHGSGVREGSSSEERGKKGQPTAATIPAHLISSLSSSSNSIYPPPSRSLNASASQFSNNSSGNRLSFGRHSTTSTDFLIPSEEEGLSNGNTGTKESFIIQVNRLSNDLSGKGRGNEDLFIKPWARDSLSINSRPYLVKNKAKFAKFMRKHAGILLLSAAGFALLSLLLIWLLYALFFHPLASSTMLSRQSDAFDRQSLIVISLDGFRSDYLDRGLSPTLTTLAKGGIRAAWMTPSFPSLTFPNHWTLATGLLPQSHGIVANDFREILPNGTHHIFRYWEPQSKNPRWWGGEPIWNTVMKSGHKAGVCMWPGSETLVQAMTPDYNVHYRKNMSAEERDSIVTSWLTLPLGERPKLVAMYVPWADEAGHAYGPDSVQVNQSIARVDEIIGRLIASIGDRKVNFIIVSDHGMASISETRTIAVPKLFNTSRIDHAENGPHIMLWPPSELFNETLTNLQNASKTIGHFDVYTKETLPARFQYHTSPRISPILLSAHMGWAFHVDPSKPFTAGHGLHGYDNETPEMRAIFIAHGPAFLPLAKEAPLLQPFPNTNLYELMARTMGMSRNTIAPNNGSTQWVDAFASRFFRTAPGNAHKDLAEHTHPFL